MTTLARGRIYWAHLPGDKRRPVLVVSPEARNALASDVLVVPVSSELRHGPWHVRLDRGEGGAPAAIGPEVRADHDAAHGPDRSRAPRIPARGATDVRRRAGRAPRHRRSRAT
jgi:hypothetical protein